MLRNEEHWLDLADAFQAAGVRGTGWYQALAGLAQATGSQHGLPRDVRGRAHGQLICIGDDATVPIDILTDIDPGFHDEFVAMGGGDPRINPRVRAGRNAPVLEVLAECDFISPEQYRRNPHYQEFVLPHGVPYICLSTLDRTPGMLTGLAVVRNERQGHITEPERAVFTSLAAHVRAAVRTQAALEGKGAALLAGAMEALCIPAFVCDRTGTVRELTPAAEQLATANRGLQLKESRLRAALASDARELEDAIGAAAIGRTRPGAPLMQTLIVRSSEHDLAPVVLDVISMPPQATEFSFVPRVLVVARGSKAANEHKAAILQAAYGMTRAESDIALQCVPARRQKQSPPYARWRSARYALRSRHCWPKPAPRGRSSWSPASTSSNKKRSVHGFVRRGGGRGRCEPLLASARSISQVAQLVGLLSHEITYPVVCNLPPRTATTTVARTILEDDDFERIDVAELAGSTQSIYVYNQNTGVTADIAELNADGSGLTWAFAKEFTWALDSTGRVVTATFTDGTVATFRSLREVDSITTDLFYEFTTPDGRYVDAGASVFADPELPLAFDSQNLVGRFYQFGIGDEITGDPRLKGFRLLFENDGTGAQENDAMVADQLTTQDGGNTPSFNFRWHIDGADVVVRHTVHLGVGYDNCAFGSNMDCVLVDERRLVPLAAIEDAAGRRVYWMEYRRSAVDQTDVVDEHSVPTTLIRFYDYQPLSAPAVVNGKPSMAGKASAPKLRFQGRSQH